MRIRGLQPYHERKALRLPGHSLSTMSGPYQRLVNQMLHYTPSHRPVHEDELDSLSFHPEIQQRGIETKPTPTYPRSSAAWYEREVWYKKEVAKQRRLPRWKRRSIPELTFS